MVHCIWTLHARVTIVHLLYLKLTHRLQFRDVAEESAEGPSQFRPTLLHLEFQHLVVVPERLYYSRVKFRCAIDLAKEICSSASVVFLSSISLEVKAIRGRCFGRSTACGIVQ
jgi:hypothetical protein